MTAAADNAVGGSAASANELLCWPIWVRHRAAHDRATSGTNCTGQGDPMVTYNGIMGYGRGEFHRAQGAGRSLVSRNWLRPLLDAIDGDIAFRTIVMMAGLLSSAAFAFGLMWL